MYSLGNGVGGLRMLEVFVGLADFARLGTLTMGGLDALNELEKPAFPEERYHQSREELGRSFLVHVHSMEHILAFLAQHPFGKKLLL